MAYKTGDLSEATNKAVAASTVASEVETDALEANLAASISKQMVFWLTVGIVSLAETAFVLFMFLGWKHLKKNNEKLV